MHWTQSIGSIARSSRRIFGRGQQLEKVAIRIAEINRQSRFSFAPGTRDRSLLDRDAMMVEMRYRRVDWFFPAETEVDGSRCRFGRNQTMTVAGLVDIQQGSAQLQLLRYQCSVYLEIMHDRAFENPAIKLHRRCQLGRRDGDMIDAANSTSH